MINKLNDQYLLFNIYVEKKFKSAKNSTTLSIESEIKKMLKKKIQFDLNFLSNQIFFLNLRTKTKIQMTMMIKSKKKTTKMKKTIEKVTVI